jgi:DNA invertase Pin-like site-specific DNA recombinase
MGRLTLNVLLSFAQFEREVSGERIRDKIAASKRKGMWMGGLVPLGYEVRDRQLTVVESEAATVRLIFQRYVSRMIRPAFPYSPAYRSSHNRTRLHSYKGRVPPFPRDREARPRLCR